MTTVPRPLSVLIVEDSPLDAELARGELTKTFGAITSEVVETAEAFASALSRAEWDVIVADHNLPRFSSTEALRTLQQTGRDIPLLIMSGSMGEHLAVAAMKAGASDYITKASVGLLGQAVARALRDAEVRRKLAESERERKDRQEEREVLGKQLEILRHLGNDIQILLAPDGSIVQVNDRALQAYGFTEDELLRLNIRDLRAPGAVGDLGASIQRALAEDGYRFTSLHRHRDGSAFPVEVSTRRLEIGEARFVQNVVRDLTEERAARAAIDYQAMLLDNMHDAVIGLGPTMAITAWNHAAERLFGWTSEEAIGRLIAETVPSEYAEGASLEEIVSREATAGQFRGNVRRKTRSGEWLDLECNSVALRGEDGALLGFVSVNRDVTANYRAQERFLQSQKMEAVGQLAGGIAHDFNNLLVVILSNASFLLEGLPPGDERRADVEDIREAGARAERLIRQLLTFSRREASNPIPTSLASVVQGIEKLLRRTIGEDILVSTASGPAPWHTRIDPGQLEQVLMNLAVNARDAMPHGGDLRIASRNEEIGSPPPGCETLPAGRYAVLEVSDTGIGMTPELASRIFEPFFTTKERGKGTGLGLSTVYGIVERAKGQIALTSEPGRGTTFTIYLPACDAEERAASVLHPVPRVRGAGETVLVVEDEDAVRQVTRRMLERNGFKVVEARSAAEALGRLESGDRLDVIVSDVVMPAGSGYHLAAMVSQLHAGVPVVLVSGYTDRQAEMPGAGPVLAKPFTELALVERVHAALSRSRAPGPADVTKPS